MNKGNYELWFDVFKCCFINESHFKMEKTTKVPRNALFILFYLFFTSRITARIEQQFSTWGTRTPLGAQGVCRGYAEIKIILQ